MTLTREGLENRTTTAAATVLLPAGEHTLELTVSSGGLMARDRIAVTVVDSEPPVFTFLPADVTMDAAGTVIENGAVAIDDTAIVAVGPVDEVAAHLGVGEDVSRVDGVATAVEDGRARGGEGSGLRTAVRPPTTAVAPRPATTSARQKRTRTARTAPRGG